MPDYNFYELSNVLKKINERLEKVECCCSSLNGTNLGLGETIFYRKNRHNVLEFKSLLAGNNISLTSTNNSITINSTGSTVDCQDIKDCIGIDPLGASNKYLNEQGNFVTVSGSGFSCADLLTCSTTNLPEGSNLYYTNSRAITALTGQNISLFTNDSGYITSSALSPYLTIASASATYQPIGTYATATNSMNFTNKTGNISQWTNDSGYITSSALSPYLLSSTASSTYEPIITPGTTAQYWRGDKTWQNFPTIPSGTVTSVGGTGTVSGLTLTGTVTSSGNLTLGGTLSLTSGDVTTGLGFTPYNATNPNSYIPLTALSSTATGLTYTNTTGVFSLTSGYIIPTTTEQTNWDTAYTNRITSLTTTGTSGAATLIGNTLNIPQYSGGGSGTVTNVSALTLGTTGTDLSSTVANSTTTPVITLNVPTASAINRGVLSSTDWSTFNNKLDTSTGLYYINKATSGFTPITGSSNGISYSSLILAGTLSVGDTPTFREFGTKTGVVAAVTTRIYINTSNSISGAILLATFTSASNNLFTGLKRTIAIESTTSTNVFNTSLSSSTDDGVANTAINSLNINWNIDQWIIVYKTVGGVGDVARTILFQFYK